MNGLTKRQKECADFIISFEASNGRAATYEEIAAGLGLSSRGAVHNLVSRLRVQGVIENAPGRPRAIDAAKPVTPDQAVASILRADQFKWLQRRAAADGITLATCLREVVEEARAA